MILYFCSDSGPQNEKNYGFGHQKKLVSPQVKKWWKKLENLRRHFQKSTQKKDIFSFGKIPKWPKSRGFHSFCSSKNDVFCNFFHLFIHTPSETISSFCSILRNTTWKKTQKALFGRFIDSTDAHVFAKKLFLSKFPELFFA